MEFINSIVSKWMSKNLIIEKKNTLQKKHMEFVKIGFVFQKKNDNK